MKVLDMISAADGTPEQYVQFRCPGCGYNHCLGVGSQARGPVWGWNRDKVKPTFTPSVLAQGYKQTFNAQGHWDGGWEKDAKGKPIPFTCHSFVTDGRIQFLGDCTHALANQTVGLVAFPGDDE